MQLQKRNRILLIWALSLSILPLFARASAKTNGFYLGGQVGYSWVNYTNADLLSGFSASQIKQNGLAPHFYFGYNFGRYIGSEFGVVYGYKPHFDGIPQTDTQKKIKNNIVYLVAKGSIPIKDVVSLYAKFGIGYVVRGGIRIGYDDAINVLPEGNIVVPIYGAGIAYRFYKQWHLDLSWLQAAAKASKQLPSLHFAGVGVFYQF